MIALMYSSGLRIGEVCHLKYQDIERSNMRIHISHSKNRSDRYAVLSKTALEILTQYWFAYHKPVDWLFPKQHNKSKPIDTFYLSRHIHEHGGDSDGLNALPAILFAMLLVPTFMKTGQTF